MTAVETVRRTQRVIGATAVIRSLALGLVASLLVLALGSFASLAIPALSNRPATTYTIAILVGAAIAATMLWRARHFASPNRVALWLEERVPALQYSLVTSLEHSRSPFATAMEESIARENVGSVTMSAIRRPILTVFAAVVAALALLYVSPSGVFGRSGTGSPFRRLPGSNGAAGSRLDDIEARITPPRYTGDKPTTVRDPSSIAALAGSAISIRGGGPITGLAASLDRPIRVAESEGGWAVTLSMPDKPAALKLSDRTYERIIVLAPRADNPPAIVLGSPAHDTALRTPRLVVQLAATATDDIGLSEGHFEYLITTGSGEIFKARTINTPTVRFDGSRRGSLSATLDLASLNLVEGDVVSMRAVATDANSLTGPGVATSDTRTIRIVRASEYDSLAIEAAAPPPLDSSAVSQRMLVAMAEKLVREQPQLARPELVKRSTEIAELEDRVRRRVREILTDGEETPVQEQPDSMGATVQEMESPDEISGTQNPDLKAAYNALWEAVRSLRIAEPAAALPPMRVALKALDRARLANRLYLRGMPPRIIVDLKRVRLSGKEKGSSSARTPRSFADSARVRLAGRFEAVLESIDQNSPRAMSDLALLRVDALQTLPDLASALGDAVDAIRNGRDATLPLLRARRALDGPPAVSPALSPWSGGGGE
ncbi:MAG TPA: hypothetical protein VGN73_01965 [Gemmatimonadaceae bacterium]|nr:hypothetical protein [Gemmatimonadaceae bacterium]